MQDFYHQSLGPKRPLSHHEDPIISQYVLNVRAAKKAKIGLPG